MDQESFRQLLHKPSATSSSNASTHVRGSLLSAATAAPAGGKKKAKAVDASQPAFKPRTLKKNAKGETYRDRASERRLGTNNDYAQVEALAEDFERRNAENADRDAVEQQRKYLGGDSQHTVLVKGLDFALLEQNRARAAAEEAATDDVSLEQAFTESVAQPKKRTREEILRDLKSRRGEDGPSTKQPAAPSDEAFVEAKSAGKFKPIGFKPIGGGGATDGKLKRKKKAKTGETELDGERKKKKRKAGAVTAPESAVPDPSSVVVEPSMDDNEPTAGPSTTPSTKPATAPEPEPMDEDFDIFADAGEYTGIDLGDEEEDSDNEGPPRLSDRKRHDERKEEARSNSPLRPGKWLATSDDEREPSPPPPPARVSKSPSRSASPQRRADGPHRPASDEEEGEVEERPMRLQPLSSSMVPSIKDLLAASDQVEKDEKRKARKEKKKAAGGGGGSSEKDTKAKVDRDYQRLKAYQDKQNKS